MPELDPPALRADTPTKNTPRGDADAGSRRPLESGTGRSPDGIDGDRDAALRAAEAKAALDEAASGVKAGSDATDEAGYSETDDGLSDLEEATREQAEDRALGDRKDYRP